MPGQVFLSRFVFNYLESIHYVLDKIAECWLLSCIVVVSDIPGAPAPDREHIGWIRGSIRIQWHGSLETTISTLNLALG
jgi:hypothetical protein